MSFILDALKKSENERQEQRSAEFAGVPTSTANGTTPRWLWIVGILLLVNLAVLIGLLLRSGSEEILDSSRVNINTAAPTIREPAMAALPEPDVTNAAPSFQQRVASARQNAPQQQTAVAAAEQPSAETVQPVLISQDPASVNSDRLYPSFQEVRVNGAIDIPDLHLDIHVYGPKAEDRFVFINMSKLREGSQMSEGPIVVEITPNGVVLRYQGQTFLLPRD